MTRSDIATSNSLVDVAARINAEHRAAISQARLAVEHAAECGRLLIEAKAQVKHGEWLAWLAANTEVGARQCQKYMRLAEGWPEIEAKCESNSYLSIDGALKVFAKSTVDELKSGSDDFSLSQPFTDFDFKEHPEFPRWLQWKLTHAAQLPRNVRAALACVDDYDLPALSMCSIEDIGEAMRIIAAYVNEETFVVVSTAATSQLNAFVKLKMTAQRILVLLWGEAVEKRKKLTGEQLYRRAESVCERLGAAIENRRAQLEQVHSP